MVIMTKQSRSRSQNPRPVFVVIVLVALSIAFHQVHLVVTPTLSIEQKVPFRPMTELFPPSSSRKPPAVRKVTAEATIRDVGRVDLASSNTSSTILPQLSAEECQKRRRKCHSQDKHYNIIILDHYEQAGLGDRLFVIRRLAVLAGYLCARLYVPPPYTMVCDTYE